LTAQAKRRLDDEQEAAGGGHGGANGQVGDDGKGDVWTVSALNDEQLDRAAGVLLAQACGDALGVPYEGRSPGAVDDPPVMKGGGLGPYEPAEWSDDTEMALCIADALCADAVPGGDVCADAVPDGDACADAGMGHGGAPDHSLVRDHALVPDHALALYDGIARRFLDWFRGASGGWARDIGIQTREVLSAAAAGEGRPAERCWRAAAEHAGGGESGAGNGALMRTGVLAIVRLGDRQATAELARRVAALTHAHADVEDSSVLWTDAVQRAVLRDWSPDELLGEDHLLAGLDLLPEERRDFWERAVRESTGVEPWKIGGWGYTVTTLKAAWAAITWSQDAPDGVSGAASTGEGLRHGLEAAVRAGGDTDTVAAVAGQLLGARWGASAVPSAWRAVLHGRAPHTGGTGYEVRVAADLEVLARRIAQKGLAG